MVIILENVFPPHLWGFLIKMIFFYGTKVRKYLEETENFEKKNDSIRKNISTKIETRKVCQWFLAFLLFLILIFSILQLFLLLV